MLDAGVPIPSWKKHRDVCCCPKAARRSPTGAQKSHRRPYLIGQGGLAVVAERPSFWLNMTSAVHRGRNEQSCSEFLDRADGPRRTEGTVMNISDIRTRIESGGDEQSFLAAKTGEPEETPVLTLVGTAERTDACDPLIQA